MSSKPVLPYIRRATQIVLKLVRQTSLISGYTTIAQSQPERSIFLHCSKHQSFPCLVNTHPSELL